MRISKILWFVVSFVRFSTFCEIQWDMSGFDEILYDLVRFNEIQWDMATFCEICWSMVIVRFCELWRDSVIINETHVCRSAASTNPIVMGEHGCVFAVVSETAIGTSFRKTFLSVRLRLGYQTIKNLKLWASIQDHSPSLCPKLRNSYLRLELRIQMNTHPHKTNY